MAEKRKIGRFFVPHTMLQDVGLDGMKTVFHGLYVHQVREHFDRDAKEYICEGEPFLEIEKGQVAPLYDVTLFFDEKIGHVVKVTFKENVSG